MTHSSVSVEDIILTPLEQRKNELALVSYLSPHPETVTFGQILSDSQKLTRRIHAGGAASGEPVLFRPSSPREFMTGLVAGLESGLVMVPLPPAISSETLGEIALLVGSRFELTKNELRFCPLASQLGPALPFGGSGGVIRFTSGTTGAPKAVALSWRSIASRLDAAAAALLFSEGDRVLWCLPFHAHFIVSVLYYLRNGITMAAASPDAASLCAAARSCQATHFYGSPIQYEALLSEEWAGSIVPYCTAGPTSPELAKRYYERFGTPIIPLFGMVEVGLPFRHSRVPPVATTSVGSATPGFEVRVVGSRPLAGSSIAVGSLAVRGPGFFDGYVQNGRLVLPELHDGHFLTGDLIAECDDGFRVVGRQSSAVLRDGSYVVPEILEEEVRLMSGIETSRATVTPKGVTIEVIRGKSPAAPHSLTTHMERLFGIRAELKVVEEIPRTASGKIVREVGREF